MDFVPNVPRLVGPAGDSGGFFADLFGSAPSGSLVPSSRHDAVAHTAAELKLSSSSSSPTGGHQSKKCSMVPHNRPAISILPGESIKLDHNGLLLPSPGSPSHSSPLLAAAASPSPSPAKKASRPLATAAVDADATNKIDGAAQPLA
ncbi:uncharacterized protein LOC112349992 [Selaginella moellendorffii]|uniref:uncharacterized protein LOC112349992 n=1 Tax=Selaginella moellendorffii TaxID=88036 RepID=UPI000D1CA382|nr:uncharacterized protein LOC112349992 [Selaginella moellendorffii]XP_024541156.1 uncharacterized protein LOC112349992 [Selaginella moellendorffii]|eukprot:XP_024541155.1 uncharacterized protein LOC112349992 [Selaginella moellendorffii]